MSHRIERVNQLIRREMSESIQNLRDPRLGEFIAVTEVQTSPDLKYARVYVSSIGGKEHEAQLLEVLNAAAGHLRSELAHKATFRHTPELSFYWDDSIEQGDRIMRLLDQVNEDQD